MSQAKGGKGAAAGKGKKGAKPGGGAVDEKGEDALQAVIIADCFQDRFAPFTLEKPRCLLPLVNVPLIDYTLEYLTMVGVEEVFIYCGNGAEQVEEYIGRSNKWGPNSSVKLFQSVEFVKVSKATSVGDFLRDVDDRGLINGDFILVHGDLVATIPLDKALANHRARRLKDKDACMTVVLAEAGTGYNRIQQQSYTPMFVTEPSTGRCYHYDEINPLSHDSKMVLDPYVLEPEGTELRTDLIDCGIDICTSDVIALWTEHFDFELPRKHFLHNILKDWQLNGKQIFTEIVNEGYGARATNLQMYEAITKDVLDRRTFPLVPDSNLLKGSTYRSGGRGNVFEDVQFTHSSEVKKSVIGDHTSIGDGSIIKNCTIGRNCQIGKNVRISDAFIWDGVTIGDNTTIRRSIIANDVSIGNRCSIQPDTHVSYNVVLGDGTTLAPGSFVSLIDPEGARVTDDTSLLGSNGKGALFQKPEASDPTDPARLQQSFLYTLVDLNLSSESVSTLHSEFSDDSEDDEAIDDTTTQIQHRPRADSDSSFDLSSGAFETDAVNGLLDALRDDDVDDFDAAKLEFMGLRLSNNASEKAVRRAVAGALTTRAAELLSSKYGNFSPTKAGEVVVTGKNGVVKFIREVGVGENNAASGNVTEQAEFVLALQRAFIDLLGENLSIARAGTLLSAVLQQLYSNDVLEEEGIVKWWEDKRSGEGESASGLRAKCESLVEWLEQEDSSDEDDDDDEDEDED